MPSIQEIADQPSTVFNEVEIERIREILGIPANEASIYADFLSRLGSLLPVTRQNIRATIQNYDSQGNSMVSLTGKGVEFSTEAERLRFALSIKTSIYGTKITPLEPIPAEEEANRGELVELVSTERDCIGRNNLDYLSVLWW